MITETVHVVLQKKGILSFDVRVSAYIGEPTIRVTTKLVRINGEPDIFGDPIISLGADYIADYFASHSTFNLQDYNDALRHAEQKAQERLVLLGR